MPRRDEAPVRGVGAMSALETEQRHRDRAIVERVIAELKD